jgi:hypothetical protein
MVGLVLLGMAVALGVFIQSQSRDPSPPEDVPRSLAIWAFYSTVGLLAIIGAFQRRPAIVVAAGALCLAGLALGSVALIGFAVPGVVLILLGSRIQALSTRRWTEAVIAAAVVLLVASAAIAPLVLAEGRCWQATRSPTDPPTYIVTKVWSCSSQPVPAAGGQTFASGFESGVLTTGGGLVGAVLLLGALTLTAVTGRTPTSTGVPPSIDPAPPF